MKKEIVYKGARLMSSKQNAWRGKAMEGWVARWYTRTRQKDLEEFRREAQTVAKQLQRGSRVLEVAPGPGFFAIELGKLGDFKITGVDISRTLLEIAQANARRAEVNIDFQLGNASAMPFADQSFDFVYCSAAFKNFAEPIKALDEIYRVLKPRGEAVIVDLAKDASIDEIDTYIKQSGRNAVDQWITRWTFRHVLLKRAYRRDEFSQMAQQSRFGNCQIVTASMVWRVQFTKREPAAVGIA